MQRSNVGPSQVFLVTLLVPAKVHPIHRWLKRCVSWRKYKGNVTPLNIGGPKHNEGRYMSATCRETLSENFPNDLMIILHMFYCCKNIFILVSASKIREKAMLKKLNSHWREETWALGWLDWALHVPCSQTRTSLIKNYIEENAHPIYSTTLNQPSFLELLFLFRLSLSLSTAWSWKQTWKN